MSHFLQWQESWIQWEWGIPLTASFKCSLQLIHNHPPEGMIVEHHLPRCDDSMINTKCPPVIHTLSLFPLKNSLLAYTEQYIEYDPFLTPPDPSNPWITDDATLWELEARWVQVLIWQGLVDIFRVCHVAHTDHLWKDVLPFWVCSSSARSRASRG